MIQCVMRDTIDSIDHISHLESENDAEVSLSKFMKRHGTDYSQQEFIDFLKKRYEAINRFNSPNYKKSLHSVTS